MLLLVGKDERSAYLVGVVAVDGQHVPSPSAVFLLSVFVHHHATLCRELYVVGVVEHDKVVEFQHSSDASCALRNLLLYAAIRDVGIYLVLHHGATKTCLQELLGNSGTYSEGVALSKRTRCILYAAHDVALGVAGGH